MNWKTLKEFFSEYWRFLNSKNKPKNYRDGIVLRTIIAVFASVVFSWIIAGSGFSAVVTYIFVGLAFFFSTTAAYFYRSVYKNK